MTETAEPTRVLPVEPPRVGDLTVGWRIVVACLWIGVTVAFAAVWSASAQLGLSTWWLGPRSDPQPQAVRLLPFVVPVLMTIATFNNVRRLPVLGIGAALVTAVFGLGDVGRVNELAWVELLIAAIALAVSIASLTGRYHRAPDAGPPPPPAPSPGSAPSSDPDGLPPT